MPAVHAASGRGLKGNAFLCYANPAESQPMRQVKLQKAPGWTQCGQASIHTLLAASAVDASANHISNKTKPLTFPLHRLTCMRICPVFHLTDERHEYGSCRGLKHRKSHKLSIDRVLLPCRKPPGKSQNEECSCNMAVASTQAAWNLLEAAGACVAHH